MTPSFRAIPLAILTATATPALAQSYYVEGFLGASRLSSGTVSSRGASIDTSFSMGQTAGFAFGYDYATPWRSEIEFAYRSGDSGSFDGDLASTALMLNGYYDFAGGGRWTPYLGLGVGIATEVDFDITSGPLTGEYTNRSSGAVQAIVGVNYDISEAAYLSGEVRFFTIPSPGLTGTGGAALETDYQTVDVSLGVGFRF